MDKFIFFFRGGTGNEDWSIWIKKLKDMGVYLEGAPLIQNGRIVEHGEKKTREFLFNIEDNARGFIIVRADDMDTAVKLTVGCPVFANGGNITIRPIREKF